LSETVYLKIVPNPEVSNADSLQYIQGEVENLGERESWPDSLVFKVNLVLEELGLNILNYGGQDTSRTPEIEITLTSDDSMLTIEVSDDGLPFNPLQDVDDPDIDGAIEDRAIGGLGVHLVRTLMDDLSYERTTSGRNHLKMVAKIA